MDSVERNSGRGLFAQAGDATPLSFEERDGLKLTNVVSRGELNEAEQANILAAEATLFGRRTNPVKESYGRSLHDRMFGRVWSWAGTYRRSDKNIGVRHFEIAPSLQKAYGDIDYWVKNEVFEPDEIAVRFHHSLVSIHPFPNGNGRWSRLMADLLLHRLGRPRFSSANATMSLADETRAAYIKALRAADRHDFAALRDFMRS